MIRFKHAFAFSACIVSSTVVHAALPGWPTAKVTVRVVGEKGLPIAGAKVDIGFRDRFSDSDAPATGNTNTDGEFTAEGHSDMRLLADATKPGFYPSSSAGTTFTGRADGKWLPWNPVAEIILRPIGQPVSLFAKRVENEVPVLDQPCGYDLVKGDWVAPYGCGQNSDFVFTVHRTYRNRYDFVANATLRFSQPRDGIVSMTSPAYARNSAFRWDRAAPESGYSPEHAIRFANHDPRSGLKSEMSFDPNSRDHGYFFRVRTVERDGKIVSANYGKVTADIVIDPRETKTCDIYFTYYLNPTPLDRNLEWDPKRDLLPGLRYDEKPREP